MTFIQPLIDMLTKILAALLNKLILVIINLKFALGTADESLKSTMNFKCFQAATISTYYYRHKLNL